VLGPYDVGHRVVVRRRAGQRGTRPVFSDVLGELVELTETEITIRTMERLVRVPLDEVTHAKRVPQRRRLTATEALERIAAAGWPAPEQAHLGEWLLRAAGGWTARGNSALPIGDPGRTLLEAVDAVEVWYHDRGLPPKITVADPVGGRLTAELTRRSWTPAPPTLVQTAPLRTEDQDHSGVRLDTTPPEAWFTAVAGYKGALSESARRILAGVPLARYAGIYADDGSPLAVGRGVIADADRRWLGISLVTVDPARRRHGLGRAVVGALRRWAVEAGARDAYLQVEEHNAAAVAMYAGLGFTTHHTYVTWTARPLP
jgi:ribosomal protein S18 acetylase RimI-like enzyme